MHVLHYGRFSTELAGKGKSGHCVLQPGKQDYTLRLLVKEGLDWLFAVCYNVLWKGYMKGDSRSRTYHEDAV